MADLDFITKSTSGTVEQNLELARIAVDRFYQSKSSQSGVESLNSAQASSMAMRNAEGISLDLSDKTNNEIVDLLLHRNGYVRQKACDYFKVKIVEGKSAEDLRTRDQIKELLIAPLALTSLFGCAVMDQFPQLQYDALVIILAILNDLTKERIRQVGSIEQLACLWRKGFPDNLTSKILQLTVELTSIEMNCVACKQSKRLPELVSLTAADAKLSLPNRILLITSFRNLSRVPKSRDVIARTNLLQWLLDVIDELWKSPLSNGKLINPKDAQLAQIALETVSHLGLSSETRTKIAPEQIKFLVGLMEGQKTIKKDWLKSQQPDQEFFIMQCIQGQLLQALSRISVSESTRKTMGQLHAVQMALMYLLPGEFCINADAMTFLLELLDHLIQREDNRTIFLKYRGLHVVRLLIQQPRSTDHQTHPELNLKAVDIIISCLSYGVQDDDTLNQSLQTLLLFLGSVPDDVSLLTKILKLIHHLSTIDVHRMTLSRIPGVLDTVINSLHTQKVYEVIDECCSILTNLSQSLAHVQSQLRNLSSTTVPTIMSYLGNNDIKLQLKILTLLAIAYSTDAKGAEVTVSRNATSVLVAFLSSSPSLEIQQQVLQIMENLALNFGESDKLKHQYMAHNLLPLLVEMSDSNDENLQIRIFSLLNILSSHRACKIALDGLGILSKLDEIKNSHYNYKKENSSVKKLVEMIRPKFSGTLASLNDAIELSSDDPQAAADILLSKLTKWQLIQLVKHALNSCPDLMPLINDTIQANIANPPKKKSKQPQANQPRGIIDESPSAWVGNPASGSGASAPPVPSASSGSKKSNLASKSATSGMSVLDQISKGGVVLKKVSEEDKQRKAAKKARSGNPMASIFQGVTDQVANGMDGAKLLEQGTMEGRRYWEKDTSRFVEEVEKSFGLDYHFMKILMHLITSTQSKIPFEPLTKMGSKKDTPIDAEKLAQTLKSIGFTIKYNIVLLPKAVDPSNEYKAVIIPVDLPIEMICRTIILTVAKSTPSLTTGLPQDVTNAIHAAMQGKPLPVNLKLEITETQLLLDFKCRLCNQNFPGDSAVEISGSKFCSTCSIVVQDALKKRQESQ